MSLSQDTYKWIDVPHSALIVAGTAPISVGDIFMFEGKKFLRISNLAVTGCFVADPYDALCIAVHDKNMTGYYRLMCDIRLAFQWETYCHKIIQMN